MVDLKYSYSNNISFPSKTRRVMLLIEGKYYRLEVSNEQMITRSFRTGDEYYLGNRVQYLIFDEGKRDAIGQVDLSFHTDNLNYNFHQGLFELGYQEIPDDFFVLDKIKFLDDYQGKGLGAGILNYVINDVIKFGELHQKPFKILIQRVNTNITLPFYKKFGARKNSNIDVNQIANPTLRDKYSSVEFMIIDKPKVVGELPIELADDYDYASVNQTNPFTNPPTKGE